MMIDEAAAKQALDQISQRPPGYGLEKIPSVLDDVISSFIEFIGSASVQTADDIGALITSKHAGAFVSFAERIATRAVREADSQILKKALSALVLAGGRTDPREIALVLAPVYDACVRLGVDAGSMFDEAASYAPSEVRRLISEFPLRKPEDRSLAAMGYEASENTDGFCYRRTW